MKPPLWVKAMVLGGVLLLAWAAVRNHNEAMREEGRAEVREAWNEAVRIAQRAEDHRKAAEVAEQEKARDAHVRAIDRLAGDAASARAAADRLRDQLAAFVSASRRDGQAPGPAAGQRPSEQAAGALDLLADLFWRADREAGELAEYADRLRAAGTTCERYYDALTR